MAIQIPNPGTGNGATGDNEYVLWTKTKDNFTNTTHAASRLVGTGAGNLVEVTPKHGLMNIGYGGEPSLKFSSFTSGAATTEERMLAFRDYLFSPSENIGTGFYGAPPNNIGYGYDGTPSILFKSAEIYLWLNVNTSTHTFSIISGGRYGSSNLKKSTVYTTSNTTKEEGTGYLKASSPVLKLLHNDFEKIHEAEQLDIKVENPEIGVYKVTGTSGLRKNDGWYFSPPKDEHNNVLCMVEVEEDGDVVVVKTYKKKFDFETVTIVADYEQPTDIPDGAVVMLRFNDLPEEQLDEPIE